MVYSPTTWVNGDLITAALFNNTETQYAEYLATYGPFKFTAGASTDTIIYQDLSTFKYNWDTLNDMVYSTTRSPGAGNYSFVVQIPANIQPSVVTPYITGNCSSAGTNFYFYFNRLESSVGTPRRDINVMTDGGWYQWTSTSVVTRSSKTMKVYPGERLMCTINASIVNCGQISSLILYGASTTPATGVCYSS